MSKKDGYPHSAIPSWSGFVYQGKVALLHSIHLISQKGSSINNYKLQLDSIEDFAILDSRENPVSIHQVKAVNKKRFSSYREAFDKQKKKASKFPNAKVFFHTAVKIIDKIDAGFEIIKLYDYKRISKTSKKEKYCPLNKIDDEINTRIKRFFETHCSHEHYRLGDGYIEHCRANLEQVILKKVIFIHAKNHKGMGKDEAAFKEIITFEALYSILEKNLNNENESGEYFLWQLKGDFSFYYQLFCFNKNINDNDLYKISSYILIINKLNLNEMKAFIRSILPNKKSHFDSLRGYKDETFNKTEIRDIFFTILRELKVANNKTKIHLYWQHDGTKYTPTAISGGNRMARAVCQDIINNAIEQDLDVLYRKGKLITLEMDVPSISVLANHTMEDIPDPDESNNAKHSSYEKINRWNKVSLISLDNAKEVIND